MENLLLATLKPEAAPLRDGASARDRAVAGRDEGPSAFDRELDQTARERRDPGADRRSRAADRPERVRDRERAERGDPAASRDGAPPTQAGPGGKSDTGTTREAPRLDGASDHPTDESALTDPLGVGKDDAPAAGGNGAAPAIFDTVDALNAAEAPEDALPDGTTATAGDDMAGIADALAADPAAGPAAIASASTETQAAVPPGTATDTGPAGAATLAAGRPRADAGNAAPRIDSSADDGSDAGDSGDEQQPDARPGRSAERASERALAVRAVFGAAGADHAPPRPDARPAFVDALGATTALDGAPGVGRAQAESQTVILRLAQVSQSGRLPTVPVNTLAFHIARNVDKGINRFDIRLDPPELGRINVQMEVDGDARVRVHLVVERAEALDFLQRDARALERALADAGLDTDAESLSFSLDAGSQGEDDAASGDGPASDPLLSGIADDEPLPSPTHYVSRSGVDIRV
jgi:flagellar hook-length control protein FliK